MKRYFDEEKQEWRLQSEPDGTDWFDDAANETLKEIDEETDKKFMETVEEVLNKETKCLICGKKAEWVRVTQFSGTHHFCLEHAKEEEDFHTKDDSYAFWRELEDD